MIHRAMLAAAALMAACATTAPRLSIPEETLSMPAPEETPEIRTEAPRAVPYPGLEVAPAANADGEVYPYSGPYYTYFHRP